MSYQALNKDNDNIFIQFDRTVELIIELISVFLDRSNKSLNIANIINNNINDKINNYRFTFHIPTEIKTQQEKKTKKKNQLANTTSSLCSTTIVNKNVFQNLSSYISLKR